MFWAVPRAACSPRILYARAGTMAFTTFESVLLFSKCIYIFLLLSILIMRMPKLHIIHFRIKNVYWNIKGLNIITVV